MILPWRRRKSANRGNNTKDSEELQCVELVIPTHFRCPISLELMKDPVTLSTGITYDRESIEKWIEQGNVTCPVSNQVLTSYDFVPNHSIRKFIQEWCVQNMSHGIERIPTPRIPVTAYEVSETYKKVAAATRHGDSKKCKELVVKIKNWCKESERNKKCVLESGAGFVLSDCFQAFSGSLDGVDVDLLKELLSVLVWMFPLGVEGQEKLTSFRALRCLVWFLKSNGDLSAKQNSVLVIKELLSLDQKQVTSIVEIEGVFEALVNLIREPICPTATKASLVAIFHMISPSEISDKVVSRFVEMGMVSLVVENIVDGEHNGTTEKALGVLHRICEKEDGIQAAHENALIVPLLIKKLLRVSNSATDFLVSVLWKLCKNNERVVLDAIEVGGFEKLLVLLQVGCSESTKEKVTNLLKLLNHYRSKLNCNSSNDFKYLKQSY